MNRTDLLNIVTTNFNYLINHQFMLATIIGLVIILAGCVGDMRRNNVTTPEYINPLEPPSAFNEPIPIDKTISSASSDLEVRYVYALNNDTARKIANRVGADPEQVALMNSVFPDAILNEGRLVSVPAGIGADSPEDISEIANSAFGDDIDNGLQNKSHSAPTFENTLLEEEEIPPPRIINEPLPEDIEMVEIPESPQFSEYQTTNNTTRFRFPVNGQIISEYGAGGNEGIDIAAPAGTTVVAAGDGEIALLSQSTDSTGILLIRHSDNYYTVYSSVANILVQKGQRVRQGEKLGVVASGEIEYLHFEVRIGTEHTDPIPYLS